MNSITERIKSRLDKDKGLTQAGLARPRFGSVRIDDVCIYVLCIEGTCKIKRLSRIKNGLMVISDNPKYAPETYTGEECNRIFVYGRVLEINRSL